MFLRHAKIYCPKTIEEANQTADATIKIYKYYCKHQHIDKKLKFSFPKCTFCDENNAKNLVLDNVSLCKTLFGTVANYAYNDSDDYPSIITLGNVLEGKSLSDMGISWIETLNKMIEHNIKYGWICKKHTGVEYFLVCNTMLVQENALHALDFTWQKHFEIKTCLENTVSKQFTLFDLNLITIILQYLDLNIERIHKYDKLLEKTFTNSK